MFAGAAGDVEPLTVERDGEPLVEQGAEVEAPGPVDLPAGGHRAAEIAVGW